MITKPRVLIDKVNKEALSDCWYTSSQVQNFSRIDKLKDFSKKDPDFETLALNDFELDGTYETDFNNVAFFSKNLSDANCNFSNTEVTMHFSKASSFTNATLYFGERYPKKIKIVGYYNNTQLVEETIDNIRSSVVCSLLKFVDVNSVKVTFLESWAPHRYAGLQYFLPGTFLDFNNERIAALSINETTDVISARLEVDTAHLEVVEQRNEFNIFDFNNIVKTISKNDLAKISVNITDETGITSDVFLGNYFVNEAKVNSEGLLVLDFISLLGRMDDVQYIQSIMVLDNNVPLSTCNAKAIIDSIFHVFLSGIGIPQSQHSNYYSVDQEISQIRTFGYLPPMSCREALQNICFVNFLRVLDNRSDKIQIKKTNIDTTIPIVPETQKISKVLTQPEIRLDDSVAGVIGNVNDIALSSSEEEIFNIEYAGTYTFNNPYKVTSVQPISPFSYSYGVNYITIDAYGHMPFVTTIRGQKYEIEKNEMIHGEDNVNSGKLINIMDSLTLTRYNTPDFLAGIYAFYQKSA